MEHDEDFEDIDEETSTAEQMKKLRERLKTCQKERQEHLDGWQRMKADFVNLRSQADEQATRVKKNTKEEVLGDILPVIDSFEIAMSDSGRWEALDESWRKGVEQVYQQLWSILKKHGIEPIDALGEQFDPNRHQSIGSVTATDEAPADTVAEVLQRGYLLDGEVLRPAMVKIAE